MMPDSLPQIQQRHDAYINSLISDFERELNGVIASALARTQAELHDRLSLTDGVIDRSVANSRVLRQFDQMFLDALDRAGYEHLLTELVNRFPGQLQFFQETLKTLGAATKNGLPDIEFGPRDLQVFASQGLQAKDGLNAVMESVAASAKNRILMSVGGMKFADLAVSLADLMHRALPEAVGLAETATSTYYRIMADRGYQLIEADLPEMEIRYAYHGPLDILNRPFCFRLMAQTAAGKSWTRAQIDAMDNGQIPNVFISCGGWRCRHQWTIALD